MKTGKKIIALFLSAMLAVGTVMALSVNVLADEESASQEYLTDENTVYFEVPSDDLLKKVGLYVWGSEVYCHAWNDSGTLTGDWPGTKATHVKDNIYKYTFDDIHNVNGVIFNNGDDVRAQNIDGGQTIAKSDATKVYNNPKLAGGELYKAIGIGIEDSNGNTNVAVVGVNVGGTYGDFDYRLEDDDTITILGYNGTDTDVTIPSDIIGRKVTKIEVNSFYDNENIISVKIPDGVTSIGAGAFWCCTNLKSVIMPDSVTKIGSGVFNSCRNLTNVTISKNLTCIERETFYCCRSLTSIEIPDSVTRINDDAFAGCSSLTSIEIPESITSIGADAFAACSSLTSIKIPASITNIGDVSYGIFRACSSLTNIDVDVNNQYYSSEDGVLFDKNKTMLIRYPAKKSNTNYSIPNGVTDIWSFAFDGCNNLTSIEIPDSIINIRVYAFNDCKSLKSIKIPDSVTSIIGNTFAGCENLISITIPSSVTSIGNLAFTGCKNLTIYGYGGSYAETFANENGFKFVDIDEKTTTLTSKVGNITVSGAFDNGTTLNVEEFSVENAVVAYDITLKNENGETIQPSGKITVSIPNDKANCKVYWIKDDGTKADMNATYIDGKYEFTTDHLSVYALVENTDEPSEEPSQEPSTDPKPTEASNNNNSTSNNTNTSETGKNAVNTGDNASAIAISAILAAGALTAVILMRKKKA